MDSFEKPALFFLSTPPILEIPPHCYLTHTMKFTQLIFHQALQFSKNKTDLSRKNDVFEVSLKRKRDPTVDEDDEADADNDEGDNTALLQDKE